MVYKQNSFLSKITSYKWQPGKKRTISPETDFFFQSLEEQKSLKIYNLTNKLYKLTVIYADSILVKVVPV